MRIIYMYDDNDPRHGSVVPGNLPNPLEAYKGYRSLFLTQKTHQRESMAIDVEPSIKVLELRNEDVELPQGDDTLHWCKMFKLQDIYQKSHVVKVSIGSLNTHRFVFYVVVVVALHSVYPGLFWLPFRTTSHKQLNSVEHHTHTHICVNATLFFLLASLACKLYVSGSSPQVAITKEYVENIVPNQSEKKSLRPEIFFAIFFHSTLTGHLQKASFPRCSCDSLALLTRERVCVCLWEIVFFLGVETIFYMYFAWCSFSTLALVTLAT